MLALTLSACRNKVGTPTEDNDPYRNVTPQKVKNQVEKIQQQEDERNERRLRDVQQ